MSDNEPVDLAGREVVFERMREDLRARDEGASDAAVAPDPAVVQDLPAADEPSLEAVLDAAMVLNADYELRPPVVRIPLAWPLTIEGARLDEVALWPPVTEAVEEVVAGRMSRASMIAGMAGQPDGFLSKLRFPDAELVTAIALVIAPEFDGAA